MTAEAPEDREEKLSLVKGLVAQLLDELKVTRLFLVDDRFGGVLGPERIVALAEEAYRSDADGTREVLPEVPFELPDRGWRPVLRDHWESLSEKKRRQLLENLVLIAEAPPDADQGDTRATLADYLPRRFRKTFRELGPGDWEAEKDTILAEAAAEDRVLCFFDLDLSEADGYDATGAKSGLGLLKDATASDHVLCALVSHTFSVDEELSNWRRFAEEVGLGLGEFLPIAKDRLHDPLGFFSALKKTALNRHAERMKADASSLFTGAAAEAATDLLAIDPYDFDHVILRSSHQEGVSEVETLLRVFDVLHRDRAKAAFLEPPQSKDLQRLVQSLRSISQIGDGRVLERSTHHRRKIGRQEIFEDEGLVNRLHSPLSNGDLFRQTGDPEHLFLLLTQPCDAMVRSDGARATPGRGALVPVIPKEPGDDLRLSEVELGSVLDSRPFSAVARFRDEAVVLLEPLDLCVLNAAGQCAVDLRNPPDLPPQFHTAWKNRRARLLEIFGEVADGLDDLLVSIEVVEDPSTKDDILSSAVPRLTLNANHRLNRASYADHQFDYGLRRVGRLRSPRADHILRDYMRWQARAAEPHDLSK